MTIYKDDIKLFESKVMTDESDGGGAMTGIEIISGEHNSIFPDISDLDRAYGVVGIRSVHLKVDALTNETYFGSTVGLSEKPVDPDVEMTLMSVNNPYIQRTETKELIEKYLTSGVKYQGELFYKQVAGQRAIRIMQYTSRKPPNAGEVLILRNKITGFEQYCKIVKSEYDDQVFRVSDYTFKLRIVTCEISEPLREEFQGSAPNRAASTIFGSEISETMIADAAKYYGMKELTVDALFNNSIVQVDGIHNQLVPSSRIDNAHINVPIVELTNAPVPINKSGTEETTIPINLESQSFEIDIDNQGYVFVQTLIPTPTPATLIVSFISQGNWYELKDDGTGTLKGADPSHGSGSLDELGNVSLTTGALPDITSQIIFQWGNAAIMTELMNDNDIVVDKTFTVTTSATPNNDDMTFAWGGNVAHCSGGVISGDATGYVSNKEIQFIPNSLPLPNTLISTSWAESAGGVNPSYTETKTVTMTETATQYQFNLGGNIRTSGYTMPVTYSGVYQSWKPNVADTTRSVELTFENNGGVYTYGVIIGAYNVETGDVTIDKDLLVGRFLMQLWKRKSGGWFHSSYDVIYSRYWADMPAVSTDLTVNFKTEIGQEILIPVAAGSFDFNFNTINLSIRDQGVDVMDETVKFDINGDTYVITDPVVSKNGVDAGSFNSTDNTIELTAWATGSDDLTVLTGLYQYNVKQYVQDMVFLTAGNPVATRSLQINAIDVGGNHVIGIADSNGSISGGGFTGQLDAELGIVTLANTNPVESVDIRYNCVTYNYLPLDADLLGLDPIRLPSDGRVVIYEKGDVIVIHQDESITDLTVTSGEVYDLNEVRLATCTTTAGDAVIDLDAGTITYPTGGTFDIDYRFEDMMLLTYVDISGAMKTSRPLSHDYTAGKAKVASLLIAGDLFARYTNMFDQKTWTGDFNETLVGDEAPVAFNDTLYPFVVTDDGCITERMAIVFTSSTSFKLIGENIGQIAVGNTNTDFAPLNPTSGKPYFTLNKLGWGTGWSTNNVLRIDFFGAVYQMNLIRTVLQGENNILLDSDKFALQIRGNINKEVV